MRNLIAAAVVAGGVAAGAAAQLWQAIPVPAFGSGGQIVYDAHRDRTVLFTEGNGLLAPASTAEWDGQHWLVRDVPGAPGALPFANPRMVYDTARRETVLLYRGQTWTYDGVAWRNVASNGPGATDLNRNNVAYDELRQVFVYVEAGFASPPTHVWNGVQWQALAAPRPFPYALVTGYDPVRQQVLAWGSGGGSPYGFDGATWMPIAGGALPAAFPTADYWSVTSGAAGRLQVWAGGQRTLWTWDGNAWSPAGGGPAITGPIGYHGGTQSFVLAGNLLNAPGAWVSTDVWVFDTAWRRVDTFPAVATVVLDRSRGRIVALNPGTWEWDGVVWRENPVPGPAHATLVHDPARGGVWGIQNDFAFTTLRTWRYDGVSWQLQSPAVSPPWRRYHAASYDPLRQVVVLFSGWATWEWDGTNWTDRQPAQFPMPVAHRTSVWDPATQTTRLIATTAANVEEWEWNGAQWTFVSTPGLPGEYGTLAYDPRAAAVLYTASTGTWRRGSSGWTRIGDAAPGILVEDPQYGYLRCNSGSTWSLPPAELATAAPMGAGCAGTHGVPVLFGLGRPATVTGSLRLDLGRAPGGALAAVYASTAVAAVPLGGGCTLLLQNPLHFATLFATAGGFATVPVAVPNRPVLRGLEVHFQAAVVDAAGSLGGFASLTNGVTARLGD
jgi:hypothetical protein